MIPCPLQAVGSMAFRHSPARGRSRRSSLDHQFSPLGGKDGAGELDRHALRVDIDAVDGEHDAAGCEVEVTRFVAGRGAGRDARLGAEIVGDAATPQRLGDRAVAAIGRRRSPESAAAGNSLTPSRWERRRPSAASPGASPARRPRSRALAPSARRRPSRSRRAGSRPPRGRRARRSRRSASARRSDKRAAAPRRRCRAPGRRESGRAPRARRAPGGRCGD